MGTALLGTPTRAAAPNPRDRARVTAFPGYAATLSPGASWQLRPNDPWPAPPACLLPPFVMKPINAIPAGGRA